MTDKIQDRQRLANVITQWNQDHYDLFELSQPNEVKQEVFVIIRTYSIICCNIYPWLICGLRIA